MDKIILVVSDTEIGDGTLVDDFINDDIFCDFVSSYLVRRYDEIPIELVFNGDTFDFIKTPYNGNYPRYITDDISLAKLRVFAEAHPKIFVSLSRFLKKKKNSIAFIYGNHDPDLVFPSVQLELKEMLGGNVFFPGFCYRQGSIRIEHGSQLDFIYKVDEQNIMIDYNGGKLLNLPFITYVIFDYLVHIKREYPIFEKISPRVQFLKRVPLLSKRLALSNIKYFIKTFVKVMRNGEDPTYILPKGYVRRMIMRIIRGKYDVSFDRAIRKFLKKLKGVEILILGHSHRAKEERVKHKLLINTGTWRDEYVIQDNSNFLKPKNKYFAEVIMTGKKVLGARLIKFKSINKHLDLNMFDLPGKH